MSATAALLLLALSAPGNDTVLVQFHSTKCGPCLAMHPVVQRLADAGYPLQKIDVDQQPEYYQQYKIKGLPTFVLFHRSREVTRVEGSSNYAELEQLYHSVGFRPQSAPASNEQAFQPTQGYVNAPGQPAAPPGPGAPFAPGAAPAPEAAAAVAGNSPQQRAGYATVRLKIDDNRGYGFGTGTIIDCHEDEALVLTCGHIFRQSQGKGRITVQMFAPGAGQPVEGQLIAYDADVRDIALVSIRPGIKIEPVPIAGSEYAVALRDRVFSIGCDKGAAPSLRNSHITAVNKYNGAPNFTAEGAPVEGRSGGGLFTETGLLIGVCNAADGQGNEGLYAGLASVHWQLDQIGQTAIYKRQAAPPAANPAAMNVAAMNVASELPRTIAPSAPVTAPLAQPNFAAQQNFANQPNMNAPPRMPATMPAINDFATPASYVAPATNPASAHAAPQAPAGQGYPPADDTEVIVIVRSRSNPTRQSDIFVMDRPSAEIIQQLQSQARPASRGTSQDMLRSAGRVAPTDGTIIRGQSQP